MNLNEFKLRWPYYIVLILVCVGCYLRYEHVTLLIVPGAFILLRLFIFKYIVIVKLWKIYLALSVVFALVLRAYPTRNISYVFIALLCYFLIGIVLALLLRKPNKVNDLPILFFIFQLLAISSFYNNQPYFYFSFTVTFAITIYICISAFQTKMTKVLKRSSLAVVILICTFLGHELIQKYQSSIGRIYANNWSNESDFDVSKNSLNSFDKPWFDKKEMSKPVLRVYGKTAPKHLFVSSYNHYRGGTWTNNHGRKTIPPFYIEKDGQFLTRMRTGISPESMNDHQYQIYLSSHCDHVLPVTDSTTWVATRTKITTIQENGHVKTRMGQVGYKIFETKLIENEESLAEEHHYKARASVMNPEDLYELSSISRQIDTKGKSIEETVAIIHSYLIDNHKYDLFEPMPAGEDPAIRFLADKKNGHCQLFATAAILLLRMKGIPCRYAVGYICQRYNSSGGYYFSRKMDSHAWVEYYNNGWKTFDPTIDAVITEETKEALEGVDAYTDYLKMQNDFLIGVLGSGLVKFYFDRLIDGGIEFLANNITNIYILALTLLLSFAIYRLLKIKGKKINHRLPYLKNKTDKTLNRQFHKYEKQFHKTSLKREKSMTVAEWKQKIANSNINKNKLEKIITFLDHYQEAIYKK